MRKILVMCFAIAMCACGSTKKVSTQQVDYTKIVSELRETVSRYERRIEIIKDSLMQVKALKEKSANVADSVSHLETSYASSDAAIKDGKLHHSIENKDSINVPVRYIYIDINKYDTVYLSKIDTVYIDKKNSTDTVVEKSRLGENFFYYSGWGLWIFAVVLIFIKLKK